MRIVTCMKWGTLYGAGYVNALRRGVARHLPEPHRFVCVTDRAEGLDPGVEVVDLAPLRDGLRREDVAAGEWQKLLLFHPSLFPDEAEVLFLDLDVVVTGGLGVFFDAMAAGGLHICAHDAVAHPGRDARHRRGNSSVLGFRPAEQRHILERFLRDGVRPPVRKEQEFICEFASGLTLWPAPWVANFKSDCAHPFPRSLIEKPSLPEAARVVMFPGSIKPTDMVRGGVYVWGTPARFGIGDVPWVVDYWRGADARTAYNRA